MAAGFILFKNSLHLFIAFFTPERLVIPSNTSFHIFYLRNELQSYDDVDVGDDDDGENNDDDDVDGDGDDDDDAA